MSSKSPSSRGAGVGGTKRQQSPSHADSSSSPPTRKTGQPPTTTNGDARTTLAMMTSTSLPMGGEEAWAQDKAEKIRALITAEDANLAALLAAVGVTQHPSQIQLRDRILNGPGRDLLYELELKLKNRSFVTSDGGEQQSTGGPSQADAILAWAVHDLFDAALEESDRIMDFPRIHRWLSSCLEHTAFETAYAQFLEKKQCLDRAVPMRVFRGAMREGNQLDVRADSRDARRAAEAVKQINAGYKKKETQRQKEAKKNEGGGAVVPPQPTPPTLTFQLPHDKISVELNEETKVSRCLSMLQGVPNMPQKEFQIVSHAAAQDAQVLVDVLSQQSLDGVPCKNLFLKAKKARDEKDSCLWLVCCPTNATVDLKSLQTSLGYKDQLRFATAEVLSAALSVVQGNVTPFALVNDPQCTVNVVLDAGMMSNPDTILWFHPMINTRSLGITAKSLQCFVRASGREPVLMALTGEVKSAAVASPATSNTPPVITATPVALPGMTSPQSSGEEGTGTAAATPLSFSLTHEAAKNRVWQILESTGVGKPQREDASVTTTTERPKGHGTHNLLVKDKKTKRLYLVCLRQDREVDMKTLGDKLGAKELRLAGPADVQSAIASTQGCVTPLWMVNNVQASVTPVFDQALLNAPTTPLIVCAGCGDAKNHSQHHVVSVTVAQMLQLIKSVPGAQEVVGLAL